MVNNSSNWSNIPSKSLGKGRQIDSGTPERVIENIKGLDIEKAKEDWLWPQSKETTNERWLEELENLWYKLFYRWKNADLYTIPNNPTDILMVRTDRTSVSDIPLDLEIEGKWVIQNQISNFWANFAEKHWIKTTKKDIPTNLPKHIRERAQVVELCKPLTIQIEENSEKREVWLELIFRNYLTWSLFKRYKNDEVEEWVSLPEGMKEWDKFDTPLFTPTTKEKSDKPINPNLVTSKYPEIISKLQWLFEEFTKFMYERWYVVVDTKFEVFIDKDWNWVLWDEILTPESSRFIKREDFEAWRYISADKQIIRNIWKEFEWERKWWELKQENPDAEVLPVAHEVSEEQKGEVIWWYEGIKSALKAYIDSESEFLKDIKEWFELFSDWLKELSVSEENPYEFITDFIDFLSKADFLFEGDEIVMNFLKKYRKKDIPRSHEKNRTILSESENMLGRVLKKLDNDLSKTKKMFN